MKKVKIVTYAPREVAEKVRIAMGDAGGGIVGQYSHCSFSSVGFGRFTPNKGSNPSIGNVGEHEVVEEERIEMTCDVDSIDKVRDAILEVHPYEEVPIEVYEIEIKSVQG